jgi:high affinity Mn2+ porin
MPGAPNGLTGEDLYFKWPYDSSAQDGSFISSWGMVSEFERRYAISRHPGAVRLLAYLNHTDMGNYQQAINDSVRPADIAATGAYRYKYGFGLNWEQEIIKNVGVFSRLGWSDGNSEAWVFSDVDYTATAGISLQGGSWRRSDDTFGLAGVANGISPFHQEFFQAGGTGILAGDGELSYGWEKILETYYDAKVWKTVHAALDYQFIDNPAFNQDRGPVSVFDARLHWEF